MPDTRRVFLADGDALVLSTRRLTQILQALNTAFPSLERVATYANAQNILNKSEADLEMLAKQGLGIVYLGLESGSDEILSRIHKGATANRNALLHSSTLEYPGFAMVSGGRMVVHKYVCCF